MQDNSELLKQVIHILEHHTPLDKEIRNLLEKIKEAFQKTKGFLTMAEITDIIKLVASVLVAGTELHKHL